MNSIKIWKKFSFWNKIRLFLGIFGVGGEITLYLTDSFPYWKIIAAIVTVICITITYVFEDKNKNDVVDVFEK